MARKQEKSVWGINMKFTKFMKEELTKRKGKLVEVSFGTSFIFEDVYCGKLIEFNNHTMIFKGLSGIKIIPFENCKEITLKGKTMCG